MPVNASHSTRRRWPPGVKRIAPIDAFEQVTELRRRDHNRTIGACRPNEPATFQPLGVERHAEAVMPENLDQLAALAPEDVEIAPVRIALERFLHREGQRVHAAAHVGVAGRDPHPHARGNGDHRCRPANSAATAAFSVAASTEPVIRIRTPVASSISIAPPPAGTSGAGTIGFDSATTFAGTKPTW